MAQSLRLPNRPIGEPVASGRCPSDDDLLAFALGKLGAGRIPGIETHLDACGSCQRVLSEAAHALATAVTSPLVEHSADWNTTFQRGAVVDSRYVIERFITRGGMGEVYEAFDRKLSQRVALKTVTSTDGDDDRAVRRLKAEVQLARLVSHPNVCRMYDLGTHVLPGASNEIHFLTMEFVEGETLGQRLRLAGALPFDEAKKVTRDLLLGLRAVHAAGVLHRDFKSDNVMLRAGCEGGSRAVVLDFGLARALDRDEGGSASQPNLVGTFGYIAPEQWEGKPHTRASDLYAFGVVWFELLTGQLPFDDEPSSTARVKKSYLRDVTPPSHVNPELPPKLDALVLRCLERAPAHRFQNVDELLAALERLDAPPRRSPEKALAALCAGSLALASMGWILQATQPPRAVPPSSQERPFPPVTAAAGEAQPSAISKPLTPATRPTELTPVAATKVATPSSREDPPPRRPRAARIVEVTPRPVPPSLGATETGEPAATSPATSAGTAPPTPNTPPAVPLRVKKPDWENPFGAIQPAALAATTT